MKEGTSKAPSFICGRARHAKKRNQRKTRLRQRARREERAQGKRQTLHESDSELARRPAKIAAAEEMEVEMEDGLPGTGAVVEDGAIARKKIALVGEVCGDELEPT